MGNGPAIQPVQLFVIDETTGTRLTGLFNVLGNNGLLGLAVTEIGNPIDTLESRSPSLIRLNTIGGIALSEITAKAAASLAYGFNQANAFVAVNVNRMSAADSLVAANTNALFVAAAGYGFNGTDATGLDRLRTASVVNGGNATVPLGVQLVESPSNWSQAVEAAVTVQASTSKAAVAGQRHVCTAIGGSLVGVAAIPAPLYLRLRDGATGAGTILWSQGFVVPVGTSVNFALSGLNIVGTTNTAMTLEWSAAPGATNFQAVSLSGRTLA